MKNLKNFKKNFKCILILMVLFTLYIFLCASSYATQVTEDIAESVFRLHVIANSDSKEDQDLKYLVRDELLQYMNTLAKDATSKEEVIQIANAHKQDFNQIAKDTILSQGYDYDVNVKIGNFTFPSKTYGDITLPAGDYDALRIEIGQAQGQNWWCVMFPPLCFVDVSSGIVDDDSKELMKDNLTEEEYALISDSNDTIHFKFKIVEFLQNQKILTAKH